MKRNTKRSKAQGPRSTKTRKAPGEKRKVAEGADNVDLRAQLVNGGEVGLITAVSLPEDMVTSLRGILLDFDPSLYRREHVSRKALADPELFHEELVGPWLSRHPVFRKAEVRDSGRGLHALLLFQRPVEFAAAGDRQLWAGVVKVVQRLLPTDPDCPGITALTRPVKSVNSKTGRKVRRLKKGQPIAPEEVLALYEQAKAAPFRSVASLLFGTERISPCPVCEAEDSSLGVLDHAGKCYKCGKVGIGQLFDVFVKPRQKGG